MTAYLVRQATAVVFAAEKNFGRSIMAARASRSVDRRGRPQRCSDAVSELLALQTAYANWLAL